MINFKLLKSYCCIALLFTSFSSHATDSRDFEFYYQGIYSDEVTLNQAKAIFHDFSASIAQPVHFNGGPTIDDVETAIDDKPFDLLLWGYSDDANNRLMKKGYHQLVYAPMAINMYRFQGNMQASNSPIKIALLSNSTALFSAKHFFALTNESVEILPYDNYFLIVEACFRKDVNTIVASISFMSMQPTSIKQRFTFIRTLPDYAKLSVWVKDTLSTKQKNAIAQYFSDKQSTFGNIFGTGEFKKVK